MIDLVMVVDASGSVRDDWSTLLGFVSNVTKRVNPGPDGSHVGMVRFGDDAQKIVDFSAFNEDTYNEDTFFNNITSIAMPLGGERTFINRGLRLANQKMFKEQFGMRPDPIKKVSILKHFRFATGHEH